MNQYNNIIETIASIFTIHQGELKVLLMRKKNEPYKGYWILPGNILTVYETAEQNIASAVEELTGLTMIEYEQCHLFSNLNRDAQERIMAISFMSLIDSTTVELKMRRGGDLEFAWFPIHSIPKLGYDHSRIVENAIANLQKQIRYSNVLRKLFPSDFTLPELQKVYEQILNCTLDRRNFRKKFMNLGLVEETGDRNDKTNGRPAKLYAFKEKIEEKIIF